MSDGLEISLREITTKLKTKRIPDEIVEKIEYLNDICSHSEIIWTAIQQLLVENKELREDLNFEKKDSIFNIPVDIYDSGEINDKIERNKKLVMNLLQSLTEFLVHEQNKILEHYKLKRQIKAEGEEEIVENVPTEGISTGISEDQKQILINT